MHPAVSARRLPGAFLGRQPSDQHPGSAGDQGTGRLAAADYLLSAYVRNPECVHRSTPLDEALSVDLARQGDQAGRTGGLVARGGTIGALTHTVYPPADRPEVEVLVDGVRHHGELRMWDPAPGRVLVGERDVDPRTRREPARHLPGRERQAAGRDLSGCRSSGSPARGYQGRHVLSDERAVQGVRVRSLFALGAYPA